MVQGNCDLVNVMLEVLILESIYSKLVTNTIKGYVDRTLGSLLTKNSPTKREHIFTKKWTENLIEDIMIWSRIILRNVARRFFYTE